MSDQDTLSAPIGPGPDEQETFAQQVARAIYNLEYGRIAATEGRGITADYYIKLGKDQLLKAHERLEPMSPITFWTLWRSAKAIEQLAETTRKHTKNEIKLERVKDAENTIE